MESIMIENKGDENIIQVNSKSKDEIYLLLSDYPYITKLLVVNFKGEIL